MYGQKNAGVTQTMDEESLLPTIITNQIHPASSTSGLREPDIIQRVESKFRELLASIKILGARAWMQFWGAVFEIFEVHGGR